MNLNVVWDCARTAAGSASALDEYVVAADDMLVAHGIAAHFQGKDVAIAHDVVQRDALRLLGGLDGQTRGDAAGQRQAVAGAGARARGQHVDGAAAVVDAVEQALLFQVGNVLVHSGQAFQPHPARNLFKRWRVAVAGHKRLEEVENLFLPSGDSHGSCYSEYFSLPLSKFSILEEMNM